MDSDFKFCCFSRSSSYSLWQTVHTQTWHYSQTRKPDVVTLLCVTSLLSFMRAVGAKSGQGARACNVRCSHYAESIDTWNLQITHDSELMCYLSVHLNLLTSVYASATHNKQFSTFTFIDTLWIRGLWCHFQWKCIYMHFWWLCNFCIVQYLKLGSKPFTKSTKMQQ